MANPLQQIVNNAANGKWDGSVQSPSDVIKHYGEVNYDTTESGLAFLGNNSDSAINAVNQQALWDREDNLRKAAELREDTSMDRIVQAAKRNGINPIFLLDSLNANTTGSAASYSTSAAKTSNYDSNARTEQANSAKTLGALITAIGIIVAAIL